MDLLITSIANLIEIDFGDVPYYDRSAKQILSKIIIRKDSIRFVKLSDGNGVNIMLEYEFNIPLSSTGVKNALPVESINGASPIDDSDLYDKIVALM